MFPHEVLGGGYVYEELVPPGVDHNSLKVVCIVEVESVKWIQ